MTGPRVTDPKVFKRVVRSQLESFLENQSFFVAEQFGFRRSRSTELAIAHLHRAIIEPLGAGDLAMGMFLDVRAALNCVRHSYLLQMLEQVGCCAELVL